MMTSTTKEQNNQLNDEADDFPIRQVPFDKAPKSFTFGMSNNNTTSCIFPIPPKTQSSLSPPFDIHPETGQQIIPPKFLYGNIQNNYSGNQMTCGYQPKTQPKNDNKIHIESLYNKLGEARKKIAELNKFIDEIYEILPKIQ